MDVGNFIALNKQSATGVVGSTRSSGMVGASSDANCSSGWWFVGGAALGVVGTLVMQAFGPQMGSAIKASTKRRAAAW